MQWNSPWGNRLILGREGNYFVAYDAWPGGGNEIKRLPGLIWKTEFMAVVKITTPVVHLASFYPLSFFFFCLSPLFSFFIFIFAVFSISARLLRGNGLDVLVSYKVKINFLIQRLIESSRCVSHIGASGARSLFFFHQIRFSKLIDQLCRPARSKRTRGKKGK